MLEERFERLWQRFGVHDPETRQAGLALLAAYDGPGRHYHNVAHLDDVLQKLDWAKKALGETGELQMMAPEETAKMFDVIELALWYHDAVYDAKAKDNEAKSRDWFLSDAHEFGLAPALQKDIAALIDLTAHHKEARTLPECIMTDCDLAILGAAKPAFDAYDAGIGQEYAHVPAPLYAAGRAAVLKGFYDQPQIFKTDAFRKAYEAQARQNLAPPGGLPAMLKIKDWFKA